MALPKIDVPQYTLQLPSSGESVKIRPFLVREQKQLLIAQNGDVDQQTEAVLDIVDTCTFNKLSVRRLPAYDVEYLFLQIRARSVGENIDLILTCNSCEHKQDGKLDITSVAVNKQDEHNATVELGNGVVVNLRDPDLSSVNNLRARADDADANAVISLIARSIKNIWKGEEMFDAADYTDAEKIEFIENLSPANLAKIEKFFSSLPTLRHELEFKCEECGTDNTAVLEGLQSFFL
jgi:hypothetical protein